MNENYYKKDKFNLYKLRSKLIHKKYYININNVDNNNDIILLLNKYIDNLKMIDLIYARADIESLKYGYTSYPDTLFMNKIINYNNFYSIILGFIDANIDKLDDIKVQKETLITFLNCRKKILEDYKNRILVSNRNTIIDTMINTPSYLNFYNCFLETKKNICSYELDLIISYTIGYKNFNKYSLYDIYDIYIKLKNELENYENYNMKEVAKVRQKKLIF